MLTEIRERAENALLRETLLGEARFRILAETLASAIFISQGKRLHYVNQAAVAITGYDRLTGLGNYRRLVDSPEGESWIH